ncbi:hypothetical protein GmRootV213_06580 [Variovorax sp. V213]|uniref:histidine phosphatase family protein n=1 Tax=Variovorax sp. V213 TaxID=3065955 RepID=UPI0034E8978F
MSKLIMIIRHGEKGEVPMVGVDRNGNVDQHSLNLRGWERAGALVGFFAWPHLQGIATPQHLYAPRPTSEAPSKRPAQTLQSLAARLGVVLSTAYEQNGQEALWRELQGVEGVAPVAWEHKSIIKLANLIMGRDDRTPQDWPDDRFDVIWRFARRGNGDWQFSQVPQCLLAGDSPIVIAG